MSQRVEVLRLLRNGPVCSTQFLTAHIPRFSARVFELRQDGYQIVKRQCRAHPWHKQWEFILIEQGQMVLM